ncbi:MAG: U32 family peptidase, partial [Clostridia bacterium]|nr:U32 family peptidase [Clostridia bacterium]
MTEILAPAGNRECAIAAIRAGADAIYLGFSSFSARASADNFDETALRETVQSAHLMGVKVYLAMNTLVKTDELDGFLSTLITVWNIGVDAVILQDALLGKFIHERYPTINLHLSTQAGVCNEYGAKFAKDCGFSRVILSRETPISEIQKITKIIETEVFVQGALCTAFSGQCYFSSFVGNNSGNRGRCKQPCRKKYYYNRNGENKPVFALSLSDLCVGDEIFKLIDAGVSSFKIEGRMRRQEYVSAAVSYYRSILDQKGEKEKNENLSALKRTYNRGNYTKGLAFGQDKRFLSTSVQGHLGEKVGVVKVFNGKYTVESSYKAIQGDAFKILRKGEEIGGAFYDKSDRKGFILSSKQKLYNGDDVFVTTDTALNQRLLSLERKIPVRIRLYFAEGERAKASFENVCVYSDEPLATAKSSGLTENDLRSSFLKTDSLPFDVTFETVTLSGNVFLAKSQLNAFRRNFFSAVVSSLTTLKRERLSYHTPVEIPVFKGENDKTAVIVSEVKDWASLNADIVIFKPYDYAKELPKEFINGNFEKYLYFPAFLTSGEGEEIGNLCKKNGLDGIYAENFGGIYFAKEKELRLFVGTGINLSNALAVEELLTVIPDCYYAVSKEISDKETALLCKGNQAFSLCDGDLKLMDLCYCPFGKTCKDCD